MKAVADEVVAEFATEVGTEGPVAIVGGRTQWGVGGESHAGTRLVRAPGGIVEHEPAELTVKVYAGTTLHELDAALAPHGQMVPFDSPKPDEATVGGVLAVGHSGPRRLKYGHIRDLLLQVTYVNAAGETVVCVFVATRLNIHTWCETAELASEFVDIAERQRELTRQYQTSAGRRSSSRGDVDREEPADDADD